MPVELKILALGALLLFVHIFTATRFKTAQYGRTWNVGARDETLPPANEMTGRTMRAQANFLETFPIAIVALLGVVIAGKTSPMTPPVKTPAPAPSGVNDDTAAPNAADATVTPTMMRVARWVLARKRTPSSYPARAFRS